MAEIRVEKKKSILPWILGLLLLALVLWGVSRMLGNNEDRNRTNGNAGTGASLELSAPPAPTSLNLHPSEARAA